MQKRNIVEKQFSIMQSERNKMIAWYQENGYTMIDNNVSVILENKQAGRRVILITV